MSTTFWNVLKISPALLGASLLVASSTYAQESNLEQTAKVSPVQTAGTTVEVAVDPLAQVPQTTAIASSAYTQEQESVTDQTAQVSQTQATLAVEPTVQPLVQPPQTQVKETSVSELPPSDASPSVNQADNTLAQQVPATGDATPNSTDVLQQIESYSTEGGDNSLDQVTNVTQLSDVRPTDWAYEALRSLVERYGCIQGYPDRTFRGNRATTRFEFAAGLNACLNQIERLIAASGEGFATRKDLETIQRLVKEFQAELTTLGARADKLEGRVSYLEDRQFSTTTKLNGEVIFAISDLFGGEDNVQNRDFDDNTVFHDRVRLNFDTSFTGRDLLRTRIEAGNVATFPALGSNGITREGRLGFETNDTTNNVIVNDLFYRFPLADVATVTLFANGGNHYDYANLLNPGLSSSGTGAISRFGRFSPIYRTGAQGAGAAITIGPKSPIRIDLGYLTNEAADPSVGAGLVNGNYSALAQATFQPSKAFSIAATYVHSYDNDNLRHGTGSLTSQIEFAGGSPVVGNSYGVEASFAFTPQLILSGWGAYTDAIVIGRGGADVWTYGATLSINDFGTEGSTLGFVVGMEPKLTGSDATVGPFLTGSGGRRDDPDTGLHIEGFYKLKLTDNILITPGVIWLTAPGHNNDNDDIFVGTIRTTFTF